MNTTAARRWLLLLALLTALPAAADVRFAPPSYRSLSRVSALLDAATPTITEETGLLAIAQQFVQADRIVPSLPVLCDGKLIGLVSRHDVIYAVSQYLSSATDTHARILYLSALKDPEETPEFS